jgi:hypothetical protein
MMNIFNTFTLPLRAINKLLAEPIRFEMPDVFGTDEVTAALRLRRQHKGTVHRSSGSRAHRKWARTRAAGKAH